MSGYIIARVEVADSDKYQEYMKLTPEIVAEFGGRFLARGGETRTLEGPQENRRVVVIEFPSFDRARAFYSSPVFSRAGQLRQEASMASFIAVDGV